MWLGVPSRTESAAELARQNAGRCRTVALDVTSRESWQQAVAQVMAADTRLDVLVNNAGIHEDALLGMMSVAAWEKVRATNLDGVFHGCQAVLPAMRCVAWLRPAPEHCQSTTAACPPPGGKSIKSLKDDQAWRKSELGHQVKAPR